MKKYLISGLVVLCAGLSFAQRHEIGVKLGTVSVYGDANTKFFQIAPDNSLDRKTLPFTGSIFYKRNLNYYQGIKLSFGYNMAFFSDIFQKKYQNINASASNDILDASVTFEYNFFPINDELKRDETMWSPYVFAGLSGLIIDSPAATLDVRQRGTDYIITPSIEDSASKKKFSVGIPFGVGLKYKFGYNWTIALEALFRPTFSDDLDYNNIKKLDYNVQYNGVSNRPAAEAAVEKFLNENAGNKSKDWLNTITLGVSYSFGRTPCCK